MFFPRSPHSSLTILPVVALHVDAENGDLLPFDFILAEVDEGDADPPRRQVPLDARRGGQFGGGLVLVDRRRLLHLQTGRGRLFDATCSSRQEAARALTTSSSLGGSMAPSMVVLLNTSFSLLLNFLMLKDSPLLGTFLQETAEP